MAVTTLLFILITLLPFQIWGQSPQETVWRTPDGHLRDFDVTFTNGQSIPLSWNNWTSTRFVDTTQGPVYLWIVSRDWNLIQYAELLQRDIDLTKPGTYLWTINIPARYLATSPKYVLQFKDATMPYNQQSGELSSRGLLIINQDTTTSSSSSSSSSSTTTDLSFTTSYIGSYPTDYADYFPSEPTGLSTGAKAGIGVGVAVPTIVALAAIWMLWRKRKGKQDSQPQTTPYSFYDNGEAQRQSAGMSPIKNEAPVEMPSEVNR